MQPLPQALKSPKMQHAPKRHYAEADIIALADQNKTNVQIAKETGIGQRQIRHIVEREQARRKAEDELLRQTGIDPETLAASAKAKLEAAKRMLEKEMRAELARRQCGMEEEVRRRVVEANKKYLAMLKEREDELEADKRYYRQMINNHKPPLTADQFRTILMCLHPDGERTTEKLTEAFRLFNDRKIVLTGK